MLGGGEVQVNAETEETEEAEESEEKPCQWQPQPPGPQHGPPEKDEAESLEVAVEDEEPLPAVLKVENCSVCFLLPHFGQVIAEPLDITSFS